MAKNNSVLKWMGFGFTALLVVAGVVAGYARLGGQVEHHEVRIYKVEETQGENVRKLERIETMQKVQMQYIEETRDDVKVLIRRQP